MALKTTLNCAAYSSQIRSIQRMASDCNSGNSDFRISGISVFSPVPKFRNFSRKNSGNSWLPFLHYLSIVALSKLLVLCCCVEAERAFSASGVICSSLPGYEPVWGTRHWMHCAFFGRISRSSRPAAEWRLIECLFESDRDCIVCIS